MTASPLPGSALHGYRVLDLTSELGALAPRLLAGMGADVLRIEPPGGHPTRRRGPFSHGIPHPERSLYWFQMNAGKRSITLNVRTTDGRALFLRLVQTADFVIESLPVGELARLGLGYAALCAANPRVVLTSISLYGQDGPLAGAPGGDLIGMAAGGLMFLCGDQDRPPVRVTVEQGYAQAGLHAAAATMIAHVAREQRGRGAHIDVSVQEALLWTLANNRLHWPASGIITHRAGGGRAFGGSGERLIYEAADGYIAFYRRPESNVPLARWMAEKGVDLGVDITAWQGLPTRGPGGPPPEDVARAEEALAAWFRTQKKGDLYREGQAHGLYLCEVSTPGDLATSAHLAARGFWVQVLHDELGEMLTYPGAPFKMTASPWHTGRRPPLLGEHNIAIYCGELGLSREELGLLCAAGVV
jgi:crotonobetainyl-CoA:carnitine CoA-transferase CaiB-like acyl-CoA transferase